MSPNSAQQATTAQASSSAAASKPKAKPKPLQGAKRARDTGPSVRDFFKKPKPSGQAQATEAENKAENTTASGAPDDVIVID